MESELELGAVFERIKAGNTIEKLSLVQKQGGECEVICFGRSRDAPVEHVVRM